MKVKDLMTTKVITVGPETKIEEVAELLHEHHFTGVPVVERGKVLGVIMERDFITSESKLYLPTYIQMLKDIDFVQNDKKRLSKDAKNIINATAKDVMNPNIVTASPDMDLKELAELFATKRVNPIPVVNKSFKLVGVISRSDLIKLFSPKHIATAGERDRAPRLLDVNVSKVYEEVDSKFAFVHKTRASIWLLLSLGFFIIGFVMGVAWIVDY